jgi:starch-binding outer membrane protein, SusD/RagB family
MIKLTIMKFLINNKTIAALLVGSLLIASGCRKYMEVEPISDISDVQAFENTDIALKSVLGIYDELAGDNGYGTRISHHYNHDNDQSMTSGNLDNGRRGLGRYDLRAGNSELERPFEQLYRGLERANLAIENLPRLIEQTKSTGNTADITLAQRLYGEALTLRAQFLFDIIKIWGDAPAPFSSTKTHGNLYQGKSNRDTVYERLIADLAIAKELLPWRGDGIADDERITKGAAIALRARLALFRGGYALRRESNKMERRNDYLQYYQIARDETAELMQRRDKHTLNPSFEDLWRDLNTDNPRNQFGEIIFQVGMSGANSTSDSKVGRYDGPRIDVNSRFGQAGGGIEVLPTYFYLFDSVDTRRDVTVTLYSIGKDDKKSPRRLAEINNGRFRRDWRNPILPGNSQYLGYNFPLIRFSDVLLMFAEADNELNNGPSADAVAAFEEVRKRAYKGHESEIGLTPTSKEEFFQAIVKERSLEFADEAIRKWDLIRWNLLGAKLEETRTNLELIANREGAYSFVPRYMYWRNVGEEIEWFGSFYEPTPATAPPSSEGWKRVDWAQNVASRTIDNLPYSQAPGRLFEPNKDEVYPFPQSALDAYNGLLTQDYGH